MIFNQALLNIQNDSYFWWLYLQGIPEQKDGHTCALWVMRYMKDIIEDKDLEFATTVCAFVAKLINLHILHFIYMFDF